MSIRAYWSALLTSSLIFPLVITSLCLGSWLSFSQSFSASSSASSSASTSNSNPWWNGNGNGVSNGGNSGNGIGGTSFIQFGLFGYRAHFFNHIIEGSYWSHNDMKNSLVSDSSFSSDFSSLRVIGVLTFLLLLLILLCIICLVFFLLSDAFFPFYSSALSLRLSYFSSVIFCILLSIISLTWIIVGIAFQQKLSNQTQQNPFLLWISGENGKNFVWAYGACTWLIGLCFCLSIVVVMNTYQLYHLWKIGYYNQYNITSNNNNSYHHVHSHHERPFHYGTAVQNIASPSAPSNNSSLGALPSNTHGGTTNAVGLSPNSYGTLNTNSAHDAYIYDEQRSASESVYRPLLRSYNTDDNRI